MKPVIFLLLLTQSVFCFAADNQLTEAEKQSGWELLFNGKDMAQWRNFKKPDLDKRWIIKDGEMILSEGGGGDILTKKSYKNFDLKLEWKISEAGNSGIFILADETVRHIYSHAPEIQILDNKYHKKVSQLSGSLYDLIASPKRSHKAAGQWNQVRVILKNKTLQIWQNDEQTADIVIGSDKWNQLVANSKFATWDGFGANESGHIGLQDHGTVVSFKNIKIKGLGDE